MARTRIKNTFETANSVKLHLSGGKDSICLNDLVFKMCQSGEIDKSKLMVDFIDEEAIYPCVENIVKKMRMQWLSIGVEFVWWCIQVKHFNCFNQLTSDESFICWDETKKDVWIRKRPPWAITSHPLLRERVDTYQDFLHRLCKNDVVLTGVRAAESIQRTQYLAKVKRQGKMYPIYDWSDADVWNYILHNNLEFPAAYEYMYRVGVPLSRLRISQFFSIDTASSLVQMCEFYPELFDKICKREPNAYMAMLYFDTEFFRRKKEKKKEADTTDYKMEVFKVLKEDWRFETKSAAKLKKSAERLILMHAAVMKPKNWKRLYTCLIGGDPKGRTMRAIYTDIFSEFNKEDKK